MRIATSQINLLSSSFSSTTTRTTENLHAWNKHADFSMNSTVEDSKNISQKIKLTDRFEQQSPQDTDHPDQINQQQNSVSNDPLKKLGLGKKDPNDKISDVRFAIIKEIIERMTGRKVQVFDFNELKDGSQSPVQSDSSENTTEQSSNPAAPAMQGWGINYERVDSKSTVEGVDFSAQGSVTTADGRQIDFSAAFKMSRETSSELRVNFKDGDALIDPLVLDLSGSGASFTSDTMLFDLNSDGTLERIAAPSSTTAFLAYDKNGNGIIDNGSELFGPANGNGFADLSALDEDHNNWIDENDSSFKDLRLWQRSGSGTDTIRTLAEAGVGALYTGSSSTPFTLTNANEGDTAAAVTNPQSTIGALRDTGIYMRENGMTGFMQEVDLVA